MLHRLGHPGAPGTNHFDASNELVPDTVVEVCAVVNDVITLISMLLSFKTIYKDHRYSLLVSADSRCFIKAMS